MYFFCCSIKLSEAHQYPHVYKYLDDNIIDYIAISDDPMLKSAQALICRLKRRQLYQLVQKTNDESQFCMLSEQLLDSNYYRKCRKVNTGLDLMPKGIILHDDNGEIIENHQNWFNRYLIFSKNTTLSTKK